MERPAVLPDHSHLQPRGHKLLQGFSVGPAPFAAVQEEHVSAFRFRQLHSLKMFPDIAAGIAHIFRQHLAEFIHPFISLRLVGADEGMHAQHVHMIVLGAAGFPVDPVPQPGIIDDVIAAHQARQIKGLGGSVQGHRPQSGILADHLGGDVGMSFQDQIRPDLVGDHIHIIFPEQFHGPLQLPSLPDTAAGIVGRTEDGGVDPAFFQFLLHILIIHPPDPFFIPLQIGKLQMEPVVLQAVGKADVGRRVDQHMIPVGAEDLQGADHPAQNAVLISDMLRRQSGNAVAAGLPVYDPLKILLRRTEISEGRMFGSFNDMLLNGGHCGEIHIRHPHGDHGKSFFYLHALDSQHSRFHGPLHLQGDGVFSSPVHKCRKIVFHILTSPFHGSIGCCPAVPFLFYHNSGSVKI